MTEKHLLEYLLAKSRLDRAKQSLFLINSKISSPRSNGISSTPPNHSADPSDFTALSADKLTIIKNEVEKAEKQLEATTIRLLKVEALIESIDDLDVFNLLYREGKDLKDISQLLHISPSKAYRHRKTILEVAAPLEP